MITLISFYTQNKKHYEFIVYEYISQIINLAVRILFLNTRHTNSHQHPTDAL